MEKNVEAIVERSFINDLVMQFLGPKVTIVVHLESETLILNYFC